MADPIKPKGAGQPVAQPRAAASRSSPASGAAPLAALEKKVLDAAREWREVFNTDGGEYNNWNRTALAENALSAVVKEYVEAPKPPGHEPPPVVALAVAWREAFVSGSAAAEAAASQDLRRTIGRLFG